MLCSSTRNARLGHWVGSTPRWDSWAAGMITTELGRTLTHSCHLDPNMWPFKKKVTFNFESGALVRGGRPCTGVQVLVETSRGCWLPWSQSSSMGARNLTRVLSKRQCALFTEPLLQLHTTRPLIDCLYQSNVVTCSTT